MSVVWVVLVILLLVAFGFVVTTGRRKPKTPPSDYLPGVNDDPTTPVYTPRRTVDDVALPEPMVLQERLDVERPEPLGTRFERLRSRLRSLSLSELIARGALDQQAWDAIEERLLLADVGVGAAQDLISQLKKNVRGEDAQEILRTELTSMVDAGLDRTLKLNRHPDGKPAVVLVVGVNGTGKTTTTGKLARALVAEGKSVVLGAADTFRAAAAEQLTTWAERVGADVIRGPEGADPASVAFDAVRRGAEVMADVVVVDTAGRLHTKTGLMDELGKVHRVVEKSSAVDEVLLVIDATTGQNGLLQAKVFAEVVPVTGVVLSKLDGSARGGIVIAIQRELGVPVKLVGLGEGVDDLAPFDPNGFVDALMGRA